jgi:hypothetical protein
VSAALILALALSLAVVPASAAGGTQTAWAVTPMTLTRGQALGVGKAYLIMQTDGNLVLYDEAGRARWASNTVGRGDHATFQSDGNFVVYTSSGVPLWASNTWGHPFAVLMVQEDGNVVIYPNAAWATNTVCGCVGDPLGATLVSAPYYIFAGSGILSANAWYNLTMQTDGNLVLYDGVGRALWASNTVGRGSFAVFQGDGNFVVYTSSGGAVWSSNTWGRQGAVLALQDDGNVVVYNRAIWATNTAH